MNNETTEVLIAGAGPTGLVLALWLTRLGVRVRIIDKAAAPGETSRAIAVAARTLELYRQLDVVGGVLERGLPLAAVNVWADGKREARAEFGAAGAGLSPYPYAFMYPQDEHERLLIERLEAIGVRVERSTELVALTERSDRISARLRGPDGSESVCDATYLAGCDGARSSVRQVLEIGFPGGTYAHLFYVADVEASGPLLNGEINVAFGDDGDFVLCFGLRDAAHGRLIGTVRQDPSGAGEDLTWKDVHQGIIDRTRLTVTRVNWFSTYRVHHRVASHFRVGRSFLLGDAAHIHSPVGGQGMNTGIGDACNLGWKLAEALRGSADPRILASYEEERIPFARLLVHTTDRVFEFVTADGLLARKVRAGVAPHVLARLFRAPSIRRLLFRTVSQIRVNYRRSFLSEGQAGRVHGGDRLPWVAGNGDGDNFDALRSLRWQVHVYGTSSPELRAACTARSLHVHEYRWGEHAASAGVAQDAAYLVRPDGYVALAAAARNAPNAIARYMDSRRIQPGT
jgi:2-polyprenyl-6-methoxyphenol hydroxylase-like FAD-dependent oxidoreductase